MLIVSCVAQQAIAHGKQPAPQPEPQPEARQRPMPTFEVEDDGFGDLAQSSLGLLAQLHGDDDPDDTSSEDDEEGGAMRQRRVVVEKTMTTLGDMAASDDYV